MDSAVELLMNLEFRIWSTCSNVKNVHLFLFGLNFLGEVIRVVVEDRLIYDTSFVYVSF